MRQWLLHVYVLAERHGRTGRHGMDIVRCGHGTGVDIVLLLVQHLPIILVVTCLGESGPRRLGSTVIHVHQGHDISLGTLGKLQQVALTLATGTDTGDVQLVARRGEAFADHIAGHDRERRRGHGRVLEEFAALIIFL